MKSRLLYSLMVFFCAQPAFAQYDMSDEQWEKQAAQQIKSQQKSTRFQQQQAAPVRKNASVNFSPRASQKKFSGYGYRPQRSNLAGGYGYRPQRAQLMPQGYDKMPVNRYAEQLKGMMGAGGMGMMNGAGTPGMMGGAGAGGQQKGNLLKMLMGAQQQQQQAPQPAAGAMNPQTLLKTLMGGPPSDGSGSSDSGFGQ
jgi:hypothetical protein